MALNDVVGTPAAKAALRALDAEGEVQKRRAFAKAFDLEPEPEPSRPTPTRGYQELEAMAKARARATGRSWEEELVEVVKTAEGRAAAAAHREESARREAVLAS